jgi:Flp pilus assembly protein TadD
MPMPLAAALSVWLLFSVCLTAQVHQWPSASPEAAQTVSADLLRHPLSHKTQGLLRRAVDRMRAGKHQEAIHLLEHTLAKDPSSAAYVQSLLGFEYMQTDQFAAAVRSFETAVALLPHDAINRTNFGVSLLAVGDYERAEDETRRAHELEPNNPDIQRFLDALLTYKRAIAARPSLSQVAP